MCKRVKTFKKVYIFSNIIPIYYLSKCTGLAPLSLAYTHDQQRSDTVKMKTSKFGVLCNLFMLMWITGDQCYVFLINHVNFAGEKTNIVFTAWDFFTINYSLLGSTVGAVVTYLVILVQMQTN